MHEKPGGGPFTGEITRRDLVVRGALASGVVISGASLLAACGDDKQAPAADTKRKGGRLRIGGGAGGTADQIDPTKQLTAMDVLRISAVFDRLFDYDTSFKVVPSLAEEAQSNGTADVWTVRLRQGVTFHNGQPVTADDVIFSVARAFDKKLGYSSDLQPLTQAGVDVRNGLKKLDERTVRFTLKRPNVLFKDVLAVTTFVVPRGFRVKHPYGTGPFKVKSFSPGQESVFEANRNWWGNDGPYVDELVITNISDDSARVNALLSGQVDAINLVPLGQVPVIEGNPKLQALFQDGGQWAPITMRVDVPPFDDVRVRQAFRWIVDRDQTLKQALAGHGQIGNDLYSPQDRCFAKELPQRNQDIEKAKALLKQAGHESLTVELTTSAVGAGVVEMCQVFATQAKEAGVTVKLNQVDSGTLFGNQYLRWPFAVDLWNSAAPYLTNASLADGPGASYNETHFNDPEFNGLFRKAMTTANEGARCQVIHEMQQIQYDRGGYIIPCFPNTVDAASASLVGWKNWASGRSLNGSHLEQIAFRK